MSDINTIVFDTKTIDELDPYIPQIDGDIIQAQHAAGVKMPIYINTSSNSNNIEQTKSINLIQMQELFKSDEQQNQYISNDSFDIDNETYSSPMLISPEILDLRINALIENEERKLSQESYDSPFYPGMLMTSADKNNIDNFNLKNGNNSGSIRSINSKQEDSNYSLGQNSFTIGLDTIANQPNQTVIGKYNTTNNDALFIIGNGTSSSRSNALMVNSSGQVTVATGPTNNNHLATKEYIDNKIQQEIEARVNNIITEKQTNIINLIYPIGSIYMSLQPDANPANLFPGTTWVKIQNRFLLASGSAHSITEQGGEELHTLLPKETPLKSHTHSVEGLQIINYSGNVSIAKQELVASFPARSVDFPNKTPSYGELLGVQAYAHNISVRPTNKEFSQPIAPGTTAKNYAHVYTITLDAAHSHDISHGHDLRGSLTSTENSSSDAHNNMPPYLVVHMWKRTH